VEEYFGNYAAVELGLVDKLLGMRVPKFYGVAQMDRATYN
jgi:hypothetical protein